MHTIPELEIPEFTHRNLTSLQFVDGCRRITSAVLLGSTRIPASDAWLREVALDGAKAAEELACRLMLERTSELGRQKKEANTKRLYVHAALRRDVKNLLRHPDPEISDGKRAAAKELLGVLDKHKLPAQRRSQAEVSTAVNGLLAESATPELQRLIAESGLHRIFALLKTALEEFAALTAKEEKAAIQPPSPGIPAGGAAGEGNASDGAAQSAVAPWSVTTDGKPRLVRELKDVLSAELALLFTLMVRQARKGREPYALLLGQCREITHELNQVAKTRDTREKTAEAKRKKQEEARKLMAAGDADTASGTETGTTRGVATPAPAPVAPPRTGAAPVVGENGGDSVLAG